MTKPKLQIGRATAIVQARLGSIRMPGKVLLPVLGKPLLEHLITRLSRAESVDRIVLAIPASTVNDELVTFAEALGIPVFRGSELDVLDRYVDAAKMFPASTIVRITGDCPMVDPRTVDLAVTTLEAKKLRFVRTGLSFPDGLDVQAFTYDALLDAAEKARDNYDREHVTPYIEKTSGSRSKILEFSKDLGSLRLTIDEPEDLSVIRGIFEHFGSNEFDVAQLAALAGQQPELFLANSHIDRDAGALMSTGEKLWTRARRVIPGGNMLLSKRTEMFLQKGWPSYYSRAKGVAVWDLDGNQYFDVGYMGVGTNIVGYGHERVDEAVRGAIDDGNLSSLNSPAEVFLAERLVELHPWSEMAKFTRSGGEACAVALRIARAAAGKDVVAFCGYHGWHDWYLSANLASVSNLDQHLLAGLSPLGVPQALEGTAKPFHYNDIQGLKDILSKGDVGVIFMEPERTFPPQPGFLEEVRKLASAYNAVLVFDESTSGFRSQLGGQHLKYGVVPDLAIFGKTLGNGYAINAIIGTRAVMETAESTFISSTFWTERIGPVAALATLEAMKEERAPTVVEAIGTTVRSAWSSIASNYGLELDIRGIPAISTFSVAKYDATETKTFITQEMLKRGFLATSAFYASVAHTRGVLDGYFSNFDSVIGALANTDPLELGRRLDAGPSNSGFRRLN
jgi:glutamate-1-semialdehyde 2,1-aminomutase